MTGKGVILTASGDRYEGGESSADRSLLVICADCGCLAVLLWDRLTRSA